MAPGNQCKGEASRSEELAAGRRGVYAMFNNNGTFSVHLQLP